MAREIQSLYSLNKGVVSHLGLARADVKRLALAAETMTNWEPRVLGSMRLRSGWQYIGASYTNAAARHLKFIFATDDTAVVELTSLIMRVWIGDTLLTRPTVTTTITNGTFPTNLTGWTDLDEGSAASTWLSPNYMKLLGTGTSRAIREQQVTCLNTGTEHGIRIVIQRGPVQLRIGSSSGADDYVAETTLATGTHSLSITPTGDFYIRFQSPLAYGVYVSQCTIESAGVVTITSPYPAASLGSVRYDQSGDVVYLACDGYQQRKIERRGTRPNARSWSMCVYAPDDGPFQVENTGATTLASSALTGDVTLTASLPLFRSTHVGALFSITSVGQDVTATSASSGTATSSIRVTGITTSRTFSIVISGDASGSTVDLQRSYDDATWSNVPGQQWTANISTTYADGLDNQIVYYRLKLTTRVAPDSVTTELIIGSGSVRGIVRVTAYSTSTSVSAQVLSDLGGTAASAVWQESKWSDYQGWPSAVVLHEGRLWWAGLNGIWGSIADAYDSFDEEFVGDAGPINRTIGSGPVDQINWLMSLKGLMIGSQGAEYTARASSLDEPLTPTNFNLKTSSTQGSGDVSSVKIDQHGYFVNRARTKVFDLAFDLKAYDYNSNNLMELCPEFGYPGIVRMDVQRLPDTRIHCVRSDGTVAVCVLNASEDVIAWYEFETDGEVEDVVVLPASDETLDDRVYYSVKRTINGSTVRYLEKIAQELDCRGGTANKQADSFVYYPVAGTTLTGLDHLEGEQVVVWADGQDVGTVDTSATWTQTYTVSGGAITLAAPANVAVVGLPYVAEYKSSKLGTGAQLGSPLNQQKKINHIGLILADTHPRGVRFGPSLTVLDDMPLMEDGTEIGTDTESDYDHNLIEFPGTWTTNARVCLRAQAPRPCTVLAITMDMKANS